MSTSNLASTRWLDAPAHNAWRMAEGQRLLAFATASKLPDGFGSLDAAGLLAPGARAETLITARMTHCFALAHLQGVPGYLAYAEHGVAALRGALQDATYGGWFAHPGGHDDSGKAAYLHAFVALAASSAVMAGAGGAPALLAGAVQVLEAHFWSEEEGALREAFSRVWQLPEQYRGANSNMHAVEAFLALADVTGNSLRLQRALRIAERIIHTHAAANGYRVIEHFDALWQPLPHYNQSHPADHFRPYGSTPGHALEWARLLLHLEASLERACLHAPQWLPDCARALFDTACQQAWNVDGAPGFIYTLDWTIARWCAHACTGCMPKPAPPPRPCCSARARRTTSSGTAVAGTSSPTISLTMALAAGTTNSMRTTSRPRPSGQASPTSTMPTRRCCCRACHWHPAWPATWPAM